jgi:hypothetical protein
LDLNHQLAIFKNNQYFKDFFNKCDAVCGSTPTLLCTAGNRIFDEKFAVHAAMSDKAISAVFDFTQQFAGGVFRVQSETVDWDQFFITDGHVLRMPDKKRSSDADAVMQNPAVLASKLSALASTHDCSDYWGQDSWVCVPETANGERCKLQV